MDLSDFCEKLSDGLDKIMFQDKEYTKQLRNACEQIRDAINIPVGKTRCNRNS